jgi:6-phosphogluconolactonase/glucosamine-6-phosphate isomerase/deaminase
MFMVTGEGKAEALKTIFEGDYMPDDYPSQVVERSGHPHIVWAVDNAAAKLLG